MSKYKKIIKRKEKELMALLPDYIKQYDYASIKELVSLDRDDVADTINSLADFLATKTTFLCEDMMLILEAIFVKYNDGGEEFKDNVIEGLGDFIEDLENREDVFDYMGEVALDVLIDIRANQKVNKIKEEKQCQYLTK